ncbi:hypothetical protein QYE76_039798 [Lolium multiflorum]|uniref:Uncharacterized protein n=1 Tax=Lolium multiflorum TaxID=4521 RepID=A0AAD8TA19_LOLMU|nr:hypothetical protein QYE76_039798 [Lolium multiflorum]
MARWEPRRWLPAPWAPTSSCRCGHRRHDEGAHAAGFLISKAAFLANPQLYFQILRTAGAAAVAAAFAL